MAHDDSAGSYHGRRISESTEVSPWAPWVVLGAIVASWFVVYWLWCFVTAIAGWIL